MSEGKPKGSDLIKYWWYRALGYSDTQAKWQLKDKPSSKQPQRKLRHKHCENCRHLMLIHETQCSHCGHKDQLPTWLRSFISSWNMPPESLIPLLAGLCLFGYLVQIKLGADFFGGIGENREVNRRILILGAALPYSFSEYLDPKNAWRLFSYTCLHGNLMHIAFNLIALVQIGPLVARTFGFSRSLFIWVFSGVTAILFPALLFTVYPTIGASGSVFGFIGAAMAFGHRVGTPQGRFIRNKMIEWTVFCTLFGMAMGGVAHSAHFGGLLGGALLSFVISPPTHAKAKLLSGLFFLSSFAFIVWSFWTAWSVFEVISMY